MSRGSIPLISTFGGPSLLGLSEFFSGFLVIIMELIPPYKNEKQHFIRVCNTDATRAAFGASKKVPEIGPDTM